MANDSIYDRVLFLESKMVELDRYIRSFQFSVNLFDFAEANVRAYQRANKEMPLQLREDLPGWMAMAARDAVMSVYHFDHALDALVKGIRTTPEIAAVANLDSLDTCQPLISEYFPRSRRLRNAVGHVAELTSTPEKFAKNAFTGSSYGDGIVIENAKEAMFIDMLDGRKYTTTILGELISLEVTNQTVAQLSQIRSAAANGLSPAVAAKWPQREQGQSGHQS